MGLALVTPPQSEPVDVEEAARHLHADLEELESEHVKGLIRVARAYAESYTRRQLVTATYALTLPEFYDEVELPRPPLVSVSSIAYVDENGAPQTLATTVYDVDSTSDPGVITLADGESWPATKTQPNAVTITFIAGYGGPLDVPENVRHAIKLLVGHFNENSEAVVMPTAQQPVEMPIGAKALLDAVALVGVG